MEETMLTNRTVIKHAISLGTAAALTLCSIAPASATPVLSNTAVLKSAANNWATDVRWRRYGWGRGAVAAGVIGGLALGAAAARSSYYYGYGGYPSYGYSYGGYPAYGYSYGYAPYSTGYYGYPYSGGYYGYGYGRYGYYR
jgi:hypothetical protein